MRQVHATTLCAKHNTLRVHTPTKPAANARALTQFHAAPLTTARAVRRLTQTRLTASPLCAATVRYKRLSCQRQANRAGRQHFKSYKPTPFVHPAVAVGLVCTLALWGILLATLYSTVKRSMQRGERLKAQWPQFSEV